MADDLCGARVQKAKPISGSVPICRQTRKARFFAEEVYSYGTWPQQKTSLTMYHGKLGHYPQKKGEQRLPWQ
jgi:hypothetical protein